MNVSIITACKNRRKALEISLRSWLMFEEVKEIIITDWSSDETIDDLSDLDDRIKIIRVSDKEYFNQPQPLNLAASIATGDYILKFDVDHVLNPYYNFFETYLIDDNSFLSGSPDWNSPEYVDKNGCAVADSASMSFEQIKEWCNVYSPYFKSLFGIIFVKRENFLKCGGFNENLGHYYGFEDEELQKRFEKLGLNHKKLNPEGTSVFHLPHPDSKRLENFKGNDTDLHISEQVRNNLSKYYSGNALEYQIDYALAMYHVGKNKESFSSSEHYYIPLKTKWNIEQCSEQIYIAEEKTINPLENFPPVYYVTLEESTDRQRLLESQFNKYGIKPNSIKSKRFSESNDIVTGRYLYQLTGPTQGCIVSHLKAIKKWYESEESDYAFFCEDDLSLKTVEYWNFTWEEFINLLPDDCECVQLMTVRGDFEEIKFRDRIWNDWSETAYIMTRDYAKKIIDSYCIGDSFHLELKNLNIMPIGENILFTNVGKVYTFPLFTENVNIPTTDVNDLELENGQKPNHVYSSEYVYEWWKNNGKNKSIYDLMGKEKIKKTFVISEEDDEVPVEKTKLEELTYQYSLDTENPVSNFNIANWYEYEGHTAPALSYYLRCAERGAESHPDLAYEALIRGSYCYEKQGTRDGSSRSLLWQAQMFLPHRPEAYYLLARFSERREWWQDCYTTCDLALKQCDFDTVPLLTNVEYPGKYGILFLKGISGWWWGKGDESRSLFKDILNNYELDERSYNLVSDHLKRVNGEL